MFNEENKTSHFFCALYINIKICYVQGRGIDANALAGLLKPETQQPPTAAAPSADQTSTGYSTSYPSSVSSYDYNNYKSSNYGPAKDDGKRGYRPY